MKKILAFAGSNSSSSINKQLLNWAVQQVNHHSVNQIDISDFPMPMFGEDLEKSDGHPEQAKQLRQLISQHDAFIIASPEHNGSMPAVFKNLIDWLSRVGPEDEQGIFNNKPVLLLSSSPGPRGGQTNLQNLSAIMPYWGASIFGSYSLGDFYQQFVDGQPNEQQAEEIGTLVNNFTSNL